MNDIGSSISAYNPDLEDLRAQNHSAFKQLVQLHHKSLVNVARAIVGSGIAEEVVQESWIAAYKALPDFEGRSAIKTWLYTIVSNQARTRLRKESRKVALDDATQSSTANPLDQYQFKENGHWKAPLNDWHIDTPDGLLEQDQLHQCIQKTLELLPDLQQAVFTLRDLEQLPLSEICNILEISDSNVRVLIHRARVKFMQVIAHYQETGEC